MNILTILKEEPSGKNIHERKAFLIANEIANYYDYNLESLFERTRKRKIVTKRQIIHYSIRRHTKLSLEKIGGLFHKKGFELDHATVRNSVITITNLKETEKYIRSELVEIETILNSAIPYFDLKERHRRDEEDKEEFDGVKKSIENIVASAQNLQELRGGIINVL